jgi:hypothetical protein
MAKEKEVHSLFAHERIRHNGEWFSPSEGLIEYINIHNEKPNTYIEYDQKEGIIWEYLSVKLN